VGHVEKMTSDIPILGKRRKKNDSRQKDKGTRFGRRGSQKSRTKRSLADVADSLKKTRVVLENIGPNTAGPARSLTKCLKGREKKGDRKKQRKKEKGGQLEDEMGGGVGHMGTKGTREKSRVTKRGERALSPKGVRYGIRSVK